MSLLKHRQIGNHRRAAIRIHAKHGIVRTGEAVGTASSGQKCVQSVANEGDIGNTANQAALGGRRLI
jgi:hypothetical protein